MMVIRPVAQQDLPGLMALAKNAGIGLTSLPVDEENLARRIRRSELSMAGELERADQGYVFVLEDTACGVVAGIGAIEAAVGLKAPWYNYRVGTIVHASQELGVYSRHDTLFLSNDHTGCSALCTLFLRPDYRVQRNGSLLSKSRFLFMAQFPQLFGKQVMAELRGVSDDAGRSPFWEALGRHFFSIDFTQADYLTGVGQKSFVAELMPKHPVYIDFLPSAAQAVIGKSHENTQPAEALLVSEGFRYEGYVDIFDAGPTLQSYLTEIRAVRQSQLGSVKLAEPPANEEGQTYLISNTSRSGFRAILAELTSPQESLRLTSAQAEALQIQAGDSVRFVSVSAQS